MKGTLLTVTARVLALACMAAFLGRTRIRAAEPAKPFIFETLVDFVDDTLVAGRPISPQDIDAMMQRFSEMGVKRVQWIYYGDGHGGFVIPAGYNEPGSDGIESFGDYAETYRRINPLKVAVEAGHRHGMEVYAYYKPYETGPGVYFPEGSDLARKYGLLPTIGGQLIWMEPFVRDHPELRIKRRTDDIAPGNDTATIATIRLTKSDAAPTRITAEHLQIWTSPNNWGYSPKKVTFSFKDAVETAPADVRDNRGTILTHKGDPVRVLTLSGLILTDKYILVTTDFDGGKSDFSNAGTALIAALDPAGNSIKGVVADGRSVWAQSTLGFRGKGLMFDYGWGAAPVTLDTSNKVIPGGPNGQSMPDLDKREGFIAFARGRNAYLPAALCETEPAVQAFWLRNLDEIIATGVDGVDFREENHSTMLDTPEDYGFNDIVLEKARALPGDLIANIAKVRGDAYTAFLEEARRRLTRAGKVMRYNLQVDWFRPNPPYIRRLAYPAHIDFQWQRWIDEGLMDGAVLRIFALPFDTLYNDPIAKDMVQRLLDHKMTIAVNRYVNHGGEHLSDEVRKVKADGRFDSFIYYESQDYLSWGSRPEDIKVAYAPLLKAVRENKLP